MIYDNIIDIKKNLKMRPCKTKYHTSGILVYFFGILNMLLLYALFNHPRLLIQVAWVQKAQFSYRLDGLVP